MKRHATHGLIAVSAIFGTAMVLSGQQGSTAGAANTVFEPSASDPRIVAALAARSHLAEVMRAVDVAGVEALMAPDIVVNAPINKGRQPEKHHRTPQSSSN